MYLCCPACVLLWMLQHILQLLMCKTGAYSAYNSLLSRQAVRESSCALSILCLCREYITDYDICILQQFGFERSATFGMDYEALLSYGVCALTHLPELVLELLRCHLRQCTQLRRLKLGNKLVNLMLVILILLVCKSECIHEQIDIVVFACLYVPLQRRIEQS